MSEKNGMNYLTPKKPVSEIQRDTRRSSSAQEVAALVFVKMAQEEQFDEVTIAEHPDLFVQWDENWRGKRGDIVQDEGNLYRSIHDVNDAGQNTKPSETPSMWTPLGKPGEEFPEWSQPLGAHDAYAQGAKVSHNGKKTFIKNALLNSTEMLSLGAASQRRNSARPASVMEYSFLLGLSV